MHSADLFCLWSGMPADSALLLADWTFVEYDAASGEPAAIAALLGTEIHFAVHPAYRGRLLFRNRIREFLRPLFESRGFLTTRVYTGEKNSDMKMNPSNAEFVTRLGFVLTSHNENWDHYMLSELPYSRGD